MAESEARVNLLTSDNEQFTVDKDIAERSVLIKNMLEDIGESDHPIPLPNVTSNVFKKVLEYCDHHRKDPLPSSDESADDSRKRTTDINEWDQKFIQVDQEMLFEIILAANYLDIKPLLDVGCKTVANMIKGKTPEEIRKLFNIQNDFTPEEEAQIRKENEWAEDPGLSEAKGEVTTFENVALPKILTIAGSDSGGGADLKSFTALKTYGMSAITAVTSQNTVKVNGVHAIPTDFISSQIRDVVTDIGVDAIKTGMLHSKEVIETVVETLNDLNVKCPIVVDPVMVSTSGHRLLNEDALNMLREKLIPATTIITPNIPEAELIQDGKIGELADMMKIAESLGCKNALIKGGHRPYRDLIGNESIDEALSKMEKLSNVTVVGYGSTAEVLEEYRNAHSGEKSNELVIDVLWESDRKHFTLFVQPYIQSSNTHGTGCTLSAALAAYLGKGMSMSMAVKSAIEFTSLGIESSMPLGSGNGPLNHMHSTKILPLSLPTSTSPAPFTTHLIQSAAEHWDDYIYHPFVTQLADGTLPKESFLHYITQDYVYLVHYARIHSLAGYKSNSFADLEAFANITQHIAKESAMHVEYCNSWGISTSDLLKTVESAHNIAYTRYLTDVGHSGTLLELLVAVASCLLGYGEIGRRLKKSALTGEEFAPGLVCKKENNPYWK
ncbi:hypothetical protein E3Q22_00645 [Wallemia mellicola]|uniref:Phosphomethylpyrimidine kinase n=1 Tax=Wallemia mellicola TaxID=1708541 RepID=A0A4T0MFJ9_9BASI|nr:hypothetical protein E3Q22_00645 [Wallemia mellicola]